MPAGSSAISSFASAMPWKGLGAFVILLLLACGVGYVCGSLSFATLLVPKYTAAAEAHIVSPKYTAGMHDSLTAGMVVPEEGEDSLKPGQWPVIFNHTLGFEGEGWPSDESDSCSSNGDGPIAARRILDAAAASAAAAAANNSLLRSAADLSASSEDDCGGGDILHGSPCSSVDGEEAQCSPSSWDDDGRCGTTNDSSSDSSNSADDDEVNEDSSDDDEDDGGEEQAAESTAMRQHMSQRSREDGRKSRKGDYDRKGDGVGKRLSHEKYAYKHFAQVEQYSVGRPCTSLCLFGRNCGQNMTPATLMACHQFSYGTKTSREECTGPDGGEDGYVYKCEFTSKETQDKWRALFAGFITRSAQNVAVLVERFMVDGIGPVCAEYCAAAYGITTGRRTHWTLDNLLARARSGELQHDQVVAAAAINQPNVEAESRVSHAMEECIDWWMTWLELEDQMPNEPTIIHRVVVWGNIYSDEYMADMAIFGTSPPLSKTRWSNLRKEALRRLSLEYFGLDPNDPKQTKPAVKLSLRVRATHSNFPPCPECEASKGMWADFRKDPNRL